MEKAFEMSDLSRMTYFLGMKLWQSSDDNFINQIKYASWLLVKYAWKKNKQVNTPFAISEKQIKEDYSAKINVAFIEFWLESYYIYVYQG